MGVVIRGFGPLGGSADWNGKFISYAASIERAWNNGETVMTCQSALATLTDALRRVDVADGFLSSCACVALAWWGESHLQGNHADTQHSLCYGFTQQWNTCLSSKFFQVSVQLTLQRKHEGTVDIDGFKIWKHTIPLQAVSISQSSAVGPVTLLLIVREVTSCLCSMSRRPYQIVFTRRRKRKQGCLHRFLDEVEVRAGEGWVHNPFDDACFESAVDLWAT